MDTPKVSAADLGVNPESGESDVGEEAAPTGWQVPEPTTADPEPVAADDSAEGEQAVEAEPETEAGSEVTEPEPIKWDGNPATLPETLKPVHQDMMRGYHQKLEQLANLRKQYEAKLEAQNAPQPKQDQPPPMPTQADSDEAAASKWDARQQWFAEQAAKKMIGELQPRVAQQDETLRALEAQNRYERLTRQEGYSQEVEKRMTELASANQFWAASLGSDEGLQALFDRARHDLDLSSQARAEAKRKATAVKRSVERPAGKGVTKEASPADKYAGTIEEMGMEVLRQAGIDPYIPVNWD